MDLYGSGRPDHGDKPFGWAGDPMAAHIGNLAGRLRAEELAAGQINHARFLGVDCVGGAQVYPAQGQGQRCQKLGLSETHAPLRGTRLELNITAAQINDLDVDL